VGISATSRFKLPDLYLKSTSCLYLLHLFVLVAVTEAALVVGLLQLLLEGQAGGVGGTQVPCRQGEHNFVKMHDRVTKLGG